MGWLFLELVTSSTKIFFVLLSIFQFSTQSLCLIYMNNEDKIKPGLGQKECIVSICFSWKEGRSFKSGGVGGNCCQERLGYWEKRGGVFFKLELCIFQAIKNHRTHMGRKESFASFLSVLLWFLKPKDAFGMEHAVFCPLPTHTLNCDMHIMKSR